MTGLAAILEYQRNPIWAVHIKYYYTTTPKQYKLRYGTRTQNTHPKDLH